MIKLQARSENSRKMVIFAPALAITLTAISAMIIFLWAGLDNWKIQYLRVTG